MQPGTELLVMLSKGGVMPQCIEQEMALARASRSASFVGSRDERDRLMEVYRAPKVAKAA